MNDTFRTLGKTLGRTIGKTLGLALALSGIALTSASAAPFTVSAGATIVTSTGGFAGDLTVGSNVSVNITLDTSEGAAFNAITTPSVTPGHEFTSFYEFSNPPYSWNGNLVPPVGPGYNADVLGIVVNDNLTLTAAETGGLVADGTYDWIELLGSTTVDYCPTASCVPGEFIPADGEEWSLVIIADSSWFTDGSVIPDSLPASFISLIVGVEFDEFGNETGFALATVDTFESTLPQGETIAMPAPATAGLAGLFLIAAARIRRRR